MKVSIKRFLENEETTIGRLYLDDKFFCYTCEDQYQAVKVPDETRIPEGVYPTKLTNSPKFTPRFGHMMIEITGIPNFSFVYFHPGNTDDDTSGCVLVGDWRPPHMWKVVDSKATYDHFYALVAPHVGVGEGVTVEIVNMIRNPIPDKPVTLPDPDPKPVVVEKPLGPDVSTTLWEDLAFHVREWLRGRKDLIPKIPGRTDIIILGVVIIMAVTAIFIYRGC